MTDTTTTTVLVDDYLVKEGDSDGRPWKKIGLKDANGVFYSTFDNALGQKVIDAKGQRVEIVWKPAKDPRFKDLVSLNPVSVDPISNRADDGTADWDLIGLRKTRCLLWAHYLESPLALHMTRSDDGETKPVANRVFDFGSALVAMAEADIYHRDPAGPEETIPF